MRTNISACLGEEGGNLKLGGYTENETSHNIQAKVIDVKANLEEKWTERGTTSSAHPLKSDDSSTKKQQLTKPETKNTVEVQSNEKAELPGGSAKPTSLEDQLQ